ncbi:MAG: Dihydroorotate dehydrogenase (NAD(+)), electron transfer subunit [Candidatus Fermentimicrarchaeum limneticum]|uniref:Probable dihydroorotate dehydrogenase B (NAD(+)), electron transfer subunit n=1 Tax=Fermentimicrarchaeum limneticum TaxID=2795018 RepID=A0A7D6BAU0_FERL1|nr:MAG: Dihydroorotate dehydrogenase (NAD(+)), electron transfer subunit [Candidatus Fermentimicrarchaeum limneticum]
MSDMPVSNRVRKVVKESEEVRTIFLEDNVPGAIPGQFVMVWLPGVDEKPYALSYMDGEAAVTVQRRGKFTDEIFKLKKGDYIGVGGPYGNGFDVDVCKRPCIIAGGIGIAPLAPLAEKLARKKPIIIMGAATKEKLIFRERMEKVCKVEHTTDDGSCGRKCFASDILEEVIEKCRVDVVYGCGPEMMLKRVFEICRKNRVECQLSLERYMHCGLGVCGSCAVDGYRVCVDGPVFSSKQLSRMSEFGRFARLKYGKKVGLSEYYAWRE